MAEPFKNLLNENVIKGIASHFKRYYSSFNEKGFITDATKGLDALALKERSKRITDTMIQYLPADFEQAGKILFSSLGTPLEDDLSAGTIDDNGIAGWAIMPLTYYVALQGRAYFDLSMSLLKEMTKCATAEFDIRFFLIDCPEKTLAVLDDWAGDDNQHVRRLVSEGSRPRLPWAMHLPLFIKDPAPVIALLEKLKDDEKEYVRRFVANNLNDIAKDHPDLVADIAERWLKEASKERQKLVRHACRTLVKNGHSKALKVLGFNPPVIQQAKITILTPDVIFGSVLEFTLSLDSDSKQTQALMIDFIIHHQKANGTTSPKVFKWRTTSLEPNKTLALSKKHSIKKITTRKYYAGLHRVEVMVNGISVGKADFQLLMPELSG